MQLRNKKIVVTGGSSGIGLELSKYLIENGNEVIICGRSQEKLNRAKLAIPQLQTFQCDLAKADERIVFSNWIAQHHPDCNVLVNNAAIVHKSDFLTDDEILAKAELETQTNFLAPVALSKLLFPVLKSNRESAIIYITSGLVYAPRTIYPIYCATKSALHSFVQTFRLRTKNEAIEIYEVLMPAVDTPFHQGNPPEIAISTQQAVNEMCKRLLQGKYESRIGGAQFLYLLFRIIPSFALKKVNALQ